MATPNGMPDYAKGTQRAVTASKSEAFKTAAVKKKQPTNAPPAAISNEAARINSMINKYEVAKADQNAKNAMEKKALASQVMKQAPIKKEFQAPSGAFGTVVDALRGVGGLPPVSKEATSQKPTLADFTSTQAYQDAKAKSRDAMPDVAKDLSRQILYSQNNLGRPEQEFYTPTKSTTTLPPSPFTTGDTGMGTVNKDTTTAPSTQDAFNNLLTDKSAGAGTGVKAPKFTPEYQAGQQARYLKAIRDQDFDLLSRLEADAKALGWMLPSDESIKSLNAQLQKEIASTLSPTGEAAPLDRTKEEGSADQGTPVVEGGSKKSGGTTDQSTSDSPTGGGGNTSYTNDGGVRSMQSSVEDELMRQAQESVRKLSEPKLMTYNEQIAQASADRDFANEQLKQNQKEAYRRLLNQRFQNDERIKQQMANRGLGDSGLFVDALVRSGMATGEQAGTLEQKYQASTDKSAKDYARKIDTLQAKKAALQSSDQADTQKAYKELVKAQNDAKKAETKLEQDQLDALTSTFKALTSSGKFSPELAVSMLTKSMPSISVEKAYKILANSGWTPSATSQLANAAESTSDQTGLVTNLQLKPVLVNGKPIATLKGKKLAIDEAKFDEMVKQNKAKNSQVWAKIGQDTQKISLLKQKATAAFQDLINKNAFKSLEADGKALQTRFKTAQSNFDKWNNVFKDAASTTGEKSDARDAMAKATQDMATVADSLERITQQTTKQNFMASQFLANELGSLGYAAYDDYSTE